MAFFYFVFFYCFSINYYIQCSQLFMIFIIYLNYIPSSIMSLTGRRLNVDATTGKISLSRTLKQCYNCHQHARELRQLRQEMFLLKNDLAYHKSREQEVNILYEEIQKTRVRLASKMPLKIKASFQKQSLTQTEASSPIGHYYKEGDSPLQGKVSKLTYSQDLKQDGFVGTRSWIFRLE